MKRVWGFRLDQAKRLKELEHTERLNLGASRLPSFWATHPSTSRRVAEAGARAHMVSWKRGKPIAANRAEYLARIEGLAVGFGALFNWRKYRRRN